MFDHFVGLAPKRLGFSMCDLFLPPGISPLETYKKAANDNPRLCLKSKPQVKCH